MNFASRQDFGFGNPNIAGALFAVLVLSAFLIPPSNRWLAGLRFALAGAFFSGILLTASRGALIALAIGSFVAWVASGFPRPTMKAFLIGILAVLLLAFIFGERSFHRMSSLSPSEGSTTSRLVVYRAIPSMLVSAPMGWGWGNGAPAYENWFQNPADHTHFKNLLSTHATWIVEGGVLFALAYLLLWAAAFLLCSRNPVALGVVVVWGVSCAFSHVGGVWLLWMVPGLAILQVLCDRCRHSCWPTPRAWGYSLLAVGGALTLLLSLGFRSASNPEVRYRDKILSVGSQPTQIWFLAPDVSVLGKTYGKEFRNLGSFAIVEDWKDIPTQSFVVLSGSPANPPQSVNCREIRWLNPPATISPEILALLRQTPQVSVYWGAMRGDASSQETRRQLESLPHAQWSAIPGRGKFLGDVLHHVTKL